MCGAHLNRLHSCLYCVFFGCFTRKHIHEHAKSKRHNLGEPRRVLSRSVPAAPVRLESHHVCLRIPVRPCGPLQYQPPGLQQPGSFLLSEEELKGKPQRIIVPLGMPHPVKCRGFNSIYAAFTNEGAGFCNVNPQLGQRRRARLTRRR